MAAPGYSSEKQEQWAKAEADIANQPYARKVQALIQLITDLRALG